MRQHLTREDVTPDVIAAAYAYIGARAAAETIAAAVKPVQSRVLEGFEFYNDLSIEHGAERERITDPDDLYLSKDENAIEQYYLTVDKALRQAGLKPKDMPEAHCPVLVAEHEQVKAEWALTEAAAAMLGDDDPKSFNNRLLCQSNGLENRREFIELTAKLVANL